ncbi:hypothetical protein Mp_2g13830 [Marchantia polymorpha subsp. ruderalis]|uniref:Uncharacterized protein n=1 Tax=Marchantia polymorpha TaxID=3197 RepID=A0A2R6X1G6_MARPO|nr:hypothetical protein MARPO_0042s0012 [Marchantia polymorpha]BBN02242.1 hypothetical protein Mp_2g13830 [Marchantia polymorpha subsp. ruderalis]|eukprot:PTQ39943.1 hypothetical protein MARPO_0042s0012 [Marchantia polymorpha]
MSKEGQVSRNTTVHYKLPDTTNLTFATVYSPPLEIREKFQAKTKMLRSGIHSLPPTHTQEPIINVSFHSSLLASPSLQPSVLRLFPPSKPHLRSSSLTTSPQSVRNLQIAPDKNLRATKGKRCGGEMTLTARRETWHDPSQARQRPRYNPAPPRYARTLDCGKKKKRAFAIKSPLASPLNCRSSSWGPSRHLYACHRGHAHRSLLRTTGDLPTTVVLGAAAHFRICARCMTLREWCAVALSGSFSFSCG